MKNWWIKFGCFLTGYNYNIVQHTSEASAKAVKKYTSAILIVGILWAMIGYTFSSRYLGFDTPGAIISGIVMVIIIIQIERQIILTTGLKRTSFIVFARGLIAVVMAFLGSVVLDQIMFAEDIEKEKIRTVDREINSILPEKTLQLAARIDTLKSDIDRKEKERSDLIEEVTARPTVKLPSYSVQRIPQTRTKMVLRDGEMVEVEYDTIVKQTTSNMESMINPKTEMIAQLDQQIKDMAAGLTALEERKQGLRDELEQELRNNRGFLDELIVMKNLLFNSWVAAIFWMLWVLFFLGIELFVLFSKIGDKENDYDITVQHQKDVSIRKLMALQS